MESKTIHLGIWIMPKRRSSNRRFPIGLPLVLDIRLSFYSRALGRTRTNLSEEFVADRLTEDCDWKEIQKLLRQEAELRGVDVADLLRETLREDGFGEQINLDKVDLSILLDDPDDLLESDEEV